MAQATPQEGIALLQGAHLHLSGELPLLNVNAHRKGLAKAIRQHSEHLADKMEDLESHLSSSPKVIEHHNKLGRLHRQRNQMLRSLKKHDRKMARHIHRGHHLAIDSLHKRRLAKRIRLRSMELAAEMRRLERQLANDRDFTIAAQHRAELASLKRRLNRLKHRRLARQHLSAPTRANNKHRRALRRLLRRYRRKLSLDLEKHRRRLTRKWRRHLERYHISNQSQQIKLRLLKAQRAAILAEMKRHLNLSNQAFQAYKEKMRRKWRSYRTKALQVQSKLAEKAQDAEMGQLYWKKKSQKHKKNSQMWKKQDQNTKTQLIRVAKKGLAQKKNAEFWRQKAEARKFVSRYWKNQVKLERREREMLEKMLDGDYDEHLTSEEREELNRSRKLHWDRIEKYVSLLKKPRIGSLDSSMDKLHHEAAALTMLFRRIFNGSLSHVK